MISSAGRPNIIQILSDEHMGLALSCAGDPNVHTPNLDRLAQEGVRFERAYANTPVCTPSRGTMFSGRHAHAGPVQGFFDVWKVNTPSTATLLGEAGYRSAYIGKWHCGIVRDQVPDIVRRDPERYPGEPIRTPEDRRAGFTDWFGFEMINAPFDTYVYRHQDTEPTRLEGYQTDVLTDLAIEYLQQYDGSGPLYLVLSVEPPHFPFEVPERFRRFDPETLVLRPNCVDTPQIRREMAGYYAMIENLDWNVGRLLAALDELSGFKGDETCLVYVSDHGELMGSHGLIGRKIYPYEESVRIPAIFRWPGVIPARGAAAGLFSLVDFAPTLLGLVDLPAPSWMQGHDWSSLLRGGADDGPAEVLLEMTGSPLWSPSYPNWRGLTDGRWKYAYYEHGLEQLFDLENDPYEQHDLATTEVERLEAFRTRLLDLLAANREPFFDVLIEHGVAPTQAPRYLPPQDPNMGFPSDWPEPRSDEQKA